MNALSILGAPDGWELDKVCPFHNFWTKTLKRIIAQMAPPIHLFIGRSGCIRSDIRIYALPSLKNDSSHIFSNADRKTHPRLNSNSSIMYLTQYHITRTFPIWRAVRCSLTFLPLEIPKVFVLFCMQKNERLLAKRYKSFSTFVMLLLHWKVKPRERIV